MNKRTGPALLLVLASVSVVLLIYEAWTLVNSVWRPLLANSRALQTDFHYYYDAALRFSANRSRLYLASDDVIAGFAYPPPAIAPFVWLAKWPLGTALLAMTITSYLVLLGALQHWIRFVRRQGWAIDRTTNAALLIIAIALGPSYMNAVFGQVNAFVLASAIVFVTMAVARPLEAGSVLAAGIWLKVYPALLVLLGIWDRRVWRASICALAALLAIAILLLPLVPLETYATFVVEVLPNRGGTTAIHITNQSLVAFLERFRYPPAQFLNWTGEQAVTIGVISRFLNWIVAAAAVAWLAIRAKRGEHVAAAAGLIALIAVIVPLGWGHAYVTILPLLMLHLAVLRDATPIKSIAIGLCIVALMVPAGRRFTWVEDAPRLMQNVIYSRYLIASLVLFAIPIRPERRS